MTDDIPTVTLAGDAMVPLVMAAAALASADLPPYAIIGGVAVTIRLGRAIRATADLDAVTDYRVAPTALEVLRTRADVTYDADPHTVTIGGADVQFQEVAPLDGADVADLDDKDLLYVGAHSRALTAATLVRVVSLERDGLSAVVPVATPGALVATKLHAFADRRAVAGPDKRPGDLWDIYNLLLHLGGPASADLAGSAEHLRRAVLVAVQAHLVDGAARARSVLRLSSDERYQAITAEEIRLAAADFLERLRDA